MYSGQELQASPKDRAENVMIVDLLRNDLSHLVDNTGGGRVEVESLFDVERYRTVFQMTSTIVATLAGLEYFINSERAFVAMCHALKDAKERNRSDLVQRYTNTMAELVRNTSYSEVISRFREDIG